MVSIDSLERGLRIKLTLRSLMPVEHYRDIYVPSYPCPWEVERVGRMADGGKVCCSLQWGRQVSLRFLTAL